MVHFIQAGWRISTQAAIDFTASNLDPIDPKSLHFLGQHN